VVAVVHTHAARLFVTHRGGLREVRGLAHGPKLYHQVRRMNAMNQAHYQRHARQVRADFARETAERIAELVQRTGADEVFLGGDAEAVPILRQALPTQLASLVREPPRALALEAPREAIWDDVEPLLRQAQANHERSTVERLIEAVQAGALGVAGLEPTQAALERGQADVLVLADQTPVTPDARSHLIALAAMTDAAVEVIDQSEPLLRLGGVGALLRYR
jgi:stalled ribosome rescue protein Dom34